jgi:hypothetical protein
MGKVLGEITVKFDDGDRTFKVRRRKYSESSRVLALLRSAGTLEKNAAGALVIASGSLDVEKYAAYQIELCRMSLGDDNGKPVFSTDEIDEWGVENIGAVCEKLDEFFGPAKTSIDHAGN